MKTLLIYAHPDDDNSFNATLKQVALEQLLQQGARFELSDLYGMQFKSQADQDDFIEADDELSHQYGAQQLYAAQHETFCEDIAKEQQKLRNAEYVIFQFPLWWFSVPAILKGWFDRVLAQGFAFTAGQWFEHAPLVGRKALLTITTDSPQTAFTANGLHGEIKQLLHPIFQTLRFVGITPLEPFIAYAVNKGDNVYRQQILDEYKECLHQLTQRSVISYPGIDQFDEKLLRREAI